MDDQLEDRFIAQINENMGIAHKVCNIYFQDIQERKDVVQEMFYQLWRSYPRFKGDAKFSTWMYTVCLNTALTYFKKAQRRNNVTVYYNHYQLINESEEDDEEKLVLLHKIIETLSPLNKSITLLYLENLRYDEISAITGLSKTNISVRLVRIKNELKKIIHLKSGSG